MMSCTALLLIWHQLHCLRPVDCSGTLDRRWRVAKHWHSQENYLARYSSPDLASSDFYEWDDILLQPGDMLYMPRGAYHPPSRLVNL